jgi:hypothetical protein
MLPYSAHSQRQKCTLYVGDEVCAICQYHLNPNKKRKRYVRTLPCGHHFHGKCIDKWKTKQYTCPLCRESYFFNNIWHAVDIWDNGKYRACFNAAYNYRYRRSLFNVVLCELRRYFRCFTRKPATCLVIRPELLKQVKAQVCRKKWCRYFD